MSGLGSLDHLERWKLVAALCFWFLILALH